MKAKLSLLIALAVSASVLFIACPGEKGDIKIGVINSITGPAGVLGQSIQNGIDLAAAEINASGGIADARLLLVMEDDATDTKNAVSAFNKLVSVHKVHAVIGPASSGGVMACAPLADQYKVVILTPGAGSPAITGAGPFVFRNRVAGNLEASAMANFAFDSLKVSKVAVFRINADYGQGFSAVFDSVFRSRGGIVVTTESFDQQATDFRSQLAKLKAASPEAVYMVGVPHECGLILKQARQLGMKTQFLANNIESEELIDVAGNAANGLMYVISAYDPSASEKTRKFDSAYQAKYDKKSDMFAADGYDAVFLMKEAIERGGNTGPGIQQGLSTIKDFPGVNGIISFDQNGDVVKPVAIRQVADGKFVAYKAK